MGITNYAIKKVRKEDGSLEDFSPEKIARGIFKAAQEVGGRDRETANRLAKEVVEILQRRYPNGGTVPSKEIGDIVVKVLVAHDHAKTVQAFNRYRDLRRQFHEEMRELRDETLPIKELVNNYLNGTDWRRRENANVNVAIPGLFFYASNTVAAKYALTEVYPAEIADAHIGGDFHIHDLQYSLQAYCCGHSLPQLLLEGFNAPGYIHCRPAAHLDVTLLQIANYISALSQEWAGAQAFNHIDALLAPFVRKDGLNYRQVKQAMQTLVYNLNIPSRAGMQRPFTNLTFALKCPKDLAKQHVIIGGKLQDRTYDDYAEEMKMINLAFAEVMAEGDGKRAPFTFPIPTYSVTKDLDWDSDEVNGIMKMTARYGLPYFQNFINSDLDPSDVRSMCCHLSLDLKELRRNVTGGLFGSSDSTGSVGVCTINMPRLGYLSRDEDGFFDRLDNLMRLAKNSLEIKRKLVEENIQRGLLPYTKRYLGSLRNHFSTIGLIGMHEACLNFLNRGIETPEGRDFAVKVLKHMRGKLAEFQQETGHLYNLEATPGEGTSFRLARIDKRKYPNIKTSGERTPFYTNSTCLPANHALDLDEAMKHQEELQTLYSGGCVFHVYLAGAFEKVQGSKIPIQIGDWLGTSRGCKELVRRIAGKYRIPYYTLTPTFSICPDHAYISGEHFKCPTCGRATEVYSRVVGYIRPVQNFNDGKREEFRLRSTFEKRLGSLAEQAGGSRSG